MIENIQKHSLEAYNALNERYFFQGLGVALGVAALASRYFASCTPLSTLLFTTVSYSLLTLANDYAPEIQKNNQVALLAIAASISLAFCVTEFMLSSGLTLPASLALGAASLAGSYVRTILWRQTVSDFLKA